MKFWGFKHLVLSTRDVTNRFFHEPNKQSIPESLGSGDKLSGITEIFFYGYSAEPDLIDFIEF